MDLPQKTCHSSSYRIFQVGERKCFFFNDQMSRCFFVFFLRFLFRWQVLRYLKVWDFLKGCYKLKKRQDNLILFGRRVLKTCVTDRGLKNKPAKTNAFWETCIIYHKLTACKHLKSWIATSDDHFLFGWLPLETLQLVGNLQDPRVIQGREDINRPAFGYQGMAVPRHPRHRLEDDGNPWKIKMVHLQITHLVERNMIWTKPPWGHVPC